MSSWAKKRLDEVADLCLGKMLDAAKNRGEELPYLANVNVRWGTFDLDDLRLMRFEPGERERYGLRHGDIVMCEGGEPGRCAIWKDAVPGMMIQKALHRIRAHDGLDQRFLYYSFLHMGMTDGFSHLFTGATIKHLPGQNLAKLEVELPCLDVQRLVADRLSDLDDLIDNNRRRIKLLEDSVRLLFDEWFVRRRFRDSAPAPQGGDMPSGWSQQPLAQLTTKIGSGATPRGGDASYVEDGIALIRSQNVYDYNFVEDGLAHITDDQAALLSGVSVEAEDVLLNITGASELEKLSLPG